MVLMSLSLSLVAVQAHADEAPAAKPTQGDEQQAAPATQDWTWFGMGFESRQERFRRDMDAAVPGVGGSAGSSGTGNGQNGGQGGGK
jgi:hypothetical protein